MKKSSANKSQAKVKNFVAKNWISLATLIISLSALFVSIQSNFVSKESNQIAAKSVNPNLQLVTAKSHETLIVEVFGCYSRVMSQYSVVRHISGNAMITNTGGKGIALVATKFDDGSGKEDNFVEIYNTNWGSDSNREELKLPLQIESSETKTLYFSTSISIYYKQKEEAIQVVKNLKNKSSKAIWKLFFADGTILEKKYEWEAYTLPVSIEKYIDIACN
jgi:hypothetical protein